MSREERRNLLIALAMGLVLGCGGQETPQSPQAPPADGEASGAYVESRRFIHEQDDYYRADEVVGHLHVPHARRELAWEEHPQGTIVMQTNNLGFRDDDDIPPAKGDDEIRVLVTGDSHTDGVVWNNESFANVLEARLNSRHGGVRFNVLNGGVGYYGPYNYARFLDKFIDLEPDLFIVALYAGNDFMDACQVLESTGVFANDRPASYLEDLRACRKKIGPSIVSQGLNQLFYFKHFPTMEAAALDFTEAQLLAIHERCEKRGIGLLVLVIPTKARLEAEVEAEHLAQAREILGLSKEQLETDQRLTTALLTRLAHRGIATLDLATPLSAHAPGLYWQLDYHLSTEGHRRAAEAVLERYEGLFASLVDEVSAGPDPVPEAH